MEKPTTSNVNGNLQSEVIKGLIFLLCLWVVTFLDSDIYDGPIVL